MFQSAHHALQFAFNTLGKPIVKLSSVNSMRGSSSYGELSPQERHGQAAMVLSIVEKAVDLNGQAYLRAHYGRELFGGEHERDLANHLVRVVIGTMPTGIHNPRGVEKLVRIYFGQDISMISVRKDMRCGHPKANEYRDIVKRALDAVGARADYDADMALRNARLIGQEEVAA